MKTVSVWFESRFLAQQQYLDYAGRVHVHKTKGVPHNTSRKRHDKQRSDLNRMKNNAGCCLMSLSKALQDAIPKSHVAKFTNNICRIYMYVQIVLEPTAKDEK